MRVLRISDDPTWETGIDWDSCDNFEGDPKFVDASSKKYRLQPESPAINAGKTIANVTDDIEGESRPLGTGHDIGPYEFVE